MTESERLKYQAALNAIELAAQSNAQLAIKAMELIELLREVQQRLEREVRTIRETKS